MAEKLTELKPFKVEYSISGTYCYRGRLMNIIVPAYIQGRNLDDARKNAEKYVSTLATEYKKEGFTHDLVASVNYVVEEVKIPGFKIKIEREAPTLDEMVALEEKHGATLGRP